MDVPLPDNAMTAMLFGKLPAHGDFVARGLEPDARDALDDWLSGEMAAARATFEAEFERRYDSAMPWRFAVEDEAGWIAGALAASADSAGRRFPMLVASVAPTPAAVSNLAAACEQAIGEAFRSGWTADQLHAHLLALAVEEGDEQPESGWWSADAGDEGPPRMAGDRPRGLIAAMLDARATAP